MGAGRGDSAGGIKRRISCAEFTEDNEHHWHLTNERSGFSAGSVVGGWLPGAIDRRKLSFQKGRPCSVLHGGLIPVSCDSGAPCALTSRRW